MKKPIKKADRRRNDFCVDESPYRHVPVTTKRWNKEGTYPTISPVRSDWQNVSPIGAVALWLVEHDTLQTKALFRLHPNENVTIT